MNDNARKALDSFKRANPKLTVTMLIDYDRDHYVVEAVKDLNVMEFDPFYGIDKRTHAITGFTPAADIEEFYKALRERTLYRR